MARIRSIKPEYCTSEAIAALTVEAQLHFIKLWTYADDHGRGLDNPRLIKAALWPLADNVGISEVEALQEELELHGRIVRYEVTGRCYFEVVNWAEHQKPQHPKPSDYPAPPEGSHEDDSTSHEDFNKPHEDAPKKPRGVVGVVVEEGRVEDPCSTNRTNGSRRRRGEGQKIADGLLETMQERMAKFDSTSDAYNAVYDLAWERSVEASLNPVGAAVVVMGAYLEELAGRPPSKAEWGQLGKLAKLHGKQAFTGLEEALAHGVEQWLPYARRVAERTRGP
jgi:hypothetical protein